MQAAQQHKHTVHAATYRACARRYSALTFLGSCCSTVEQSSAAASHCCSLSRACARLLRAATREGSASIALQAQQAQQPERCLDSCTAHCTAQEPPGRGLLPPPCKHSRHGISHALIRAPCSLTVCRHQGGVSLHRPASAAGAAASTCEAALCFMYPEIKKQAQQPPGRGLPPPPCKRSRRSSHSTIRPRFDLIHAASNHSKERNKTDSSQQGLRWPLTAKAAQWGHQDPCASAFGGEPQWLGVCG